MFDFNRSRRRFFYFLTAIGFIFLLVNFSLLSGTDLQFKIKDIPLYIPGKGKETNYDTPPDPNLPKSPSWHQDSENFEDHASVNDKHPIAKLMQQADQAWNNYEDERSMTFKETVATYRRKYGRNPPPGFRDWYKFARERNAHNVDDFNQIMDDLRPFWGVQPHTIRSLAAHLHEEEQNGIAGLHIREGKVWKLSSADSRVEVMAQMVKPFVKYLPDMDIAVNRLDQPRVVVPWDDMQKLLAVESESRQIYPDAQAEWTQNLPGLFTENDTTPVITDSKFLTAHSTQYMLIAKEACPPESPARNNDSSKASAQSYKDPQGGFVTNFNLSSDLCTIGPEIENKHGFLFAPATIVASKQLLPIFGESKVNVNSDILFPANIYYNDDDRYAYDPKFDYEWDYKNDSMIWRGVPSGGNTTAENWRNMHRQRLALYTNGTTMGHEYVKILNEDPSDQGSYVMYDYFRPAEFATEHIDVGFTGPSACFPNCDFYNEVWTYKKVTTLSEQFKSKFVIDVDGQSYSGRWPAFLHSKSLGIKATIFREWHDSRLIPWRHFVPLDNGYQELYGILTYFIGLGTPTAAKLKNEPYVPRHDFEARKLGRQGKEWAAKVLRKEDIEIYLYRLLIEYARIIDDNRDRIGYSGDGSELDKYDAKNPFSVAHG